MLMESPPITAIARGCSICEPAPNAKRQRQHAADRCQRSHHDGAQAALRGVKHGIPGGGALSTILFVGIEQQDAVLGHNPDDHNEPHERGHVECCSGDEQRQDYSGNG